MRCGLRRIGALVLALALTVQLSPATAGAPASGVYFTAVNDEMVEMSRETMPFWSGGHLYVSSVIFSGVFRRMLEVACSQPPNKPVVLYSTRTAGDVLFFDLEAGTSYDGQNNQYGLPAIQRGGYVFFPIDLVCSVFGLTYSYTPVDPAPLIRVKSDSAHLSDEVFIDATQADGMRQRLYDNYIRSLPSSQSPEPSQTPATTGRRVYLVFSASDAASARSLLDVLSRQGCQAAFLLTAEEMEAEGDLLRALTAAGHSVGVRLTGTEDAMDQLRRAGDALWRAARLRTRLVWLEAGQQALGALLEAEGFCAVSCRLDQSGRPLSGAARAAGLYTQLAGLSGADLTVYLGEAQENLGGLGSLLGRLREGQYRVIAYRETL